MKTLILTTFLLSTFFAFSQRESNFYRETFNDGVTRYLNSYGVNSRDNKDDSAVLQRAIDEVARLPKGGKIIISSGRYFFVNIKLKSNVHLVFNKNATVFCTRITSTATRIFSIGESNTTVRNVSIRSNGGKFTVDFSGYAAQTRVMVALLRNVDNFLISGMHVLDNQTVHSSINFGFRLNADRSRVFMPRNGILKNLSDNNAHVGYGVIQTRVGKHILVKDIRGNGGVALRLETGSNTELNRSGFVPGLSALDDIVGRDIYCENGNSAVMVSPHSMINGKINIKRVTARSCADAVRIDAGLPAQGFPRGRYRGPSVIDDVHAIYGRNAQQKYGRRRYLPCDKRGPNLISRTLNPDGESFKAQSISAVINQAINFDSRGPGSYRVRITNVTWEGFPRGHKQTSTSLDERFRCPRNSKLISPGNTGNLVYPNPATSNITVNLLALEETISTIQIYDLSSKEVLSHSVETNEENVSLNVSSLTKGIYFVKLGERMEKLIIQ